jgi:hypothetical protein
VDSTPFDDKGQDPWGEITGENANRIDSNTGLNAAVMGVKVGRQVIVEVHPDDDPKEAGDLGHPTTVPRLVLKSEPNSRE